MSCVFCHIDPKTIWAEHGEALAIFDVFPVTAGHTLVIPRRHVPSYFDLTGDERQDLWNLVDEVCRQLQAKHAPDGFNIGINIGKAAGQTIDHLHVHVIPRYEGDVADPTGGVRGVIPAKQNYRTRS